VLCIQGERVIKLAEGMKGRRLKLDFTHLPLYSPCTN